MEKKQNQQFSNLKEDVSLKLDERLDFDVKQMQEVQRESEHFDQRVCEDLTPFWFMMSLLELLLKGLNYEQIHFNCISSE